VPFVNPVTTSGDDAPVAVSSPGLDVTVNPVIEEPPVAFAENAIDACKFPFVTELIVGAAGTVVAVTAVLADEAADVPYALDAVTVYVYCVLEARLVTVIGDDVAVNVDGDVVGDGVTTNELEAPALVFGVNATDICPLLNARPEG
jgi:hypothetical protein